MPDREPSSAAGISRRELLAMGTFFGGTMLAAGGLHGAEQPAGAPSPDTPPEPAKRYPMKKSINLWALPYPDKMSLKQCFQVCRDAGFEGVEVNYALEGEISPESSDEQIRQVGEMARQMGLQISGVCSFLFWPYSLTHADPERRRRGLELAGKMIEAARLLQTPNLLVVPGAVYAPWLPEDPPVPHDVCYRRACEAVEQLIPKAEQADVYLNVENIFANGFLHSPQELCDFVDRFESPRVCVHFDTGNIMQYHFPEHWIPLLGQRIRNVHLKEYSKHVHEFNLHTFRPLLDGTTDWPAVMAAFDRVGYQGWLTFEYFNPFPHWPESLVLQTSDAMDRMLGRKA